MFDYIAKCRRGSLYLYKGNCLTPASRYLLFSANPWQYFISGLSSFSTDELNFWPISKIITSSPKQYVILELEKDLCLPILNTEHQTPETTSVKRCKGISKSIIKSDLNAQDFYNVGVLAQPSRSVTQYHLKRHLFNIYLHKTRKVLLSRGNTKRIFFGGSRTKDSFFSLPLFARHLVWWFILFYHLLYHFYLVSILFTVTTMAVARYTGPPAIVNNLLEEQTPSRKLVDGEDQNAISITNDRRVCFFFYFFDVVCLLDCRLLINRIIGWNSIPIARPW